MAVNPSFFDQMRGFKWTPDEAEEIKRFVDGNTERQVQNTYNAADKLWDNIDRPQSHLDQLAKRAAEIDRADRTVYGGIAGGRTQCDANSPHKLLREQRDRLLKMMNSGEISLLDVTMELFITLGMLEQEIPIGTGR